MGVGASIIVMLEVICQSQNGIIRWNPFCVYFFQIGKVLLTLGSLCDIQCGALHVMSLVDLCTNITHWSTHRSKVHLEVQFSCKLPLLHCLNETCKANMEHGKSFNFYTCLANYCYDQVGAPQLLKESSCIRELHSCGQPHPHRTCQWLHIHQSSALKLRAPWQVEWIMKNHNDPFPFDHQIGLKIEGYQVG